MDLSEVIDFKRILKCYNQDGALPMGVNAIKCDLDVFCLENRPGIASSPFLKLFQREKKTVARRWRQAVASRRSPGTGDLKKKDEGEGRRWVREEDEEEVKKGEIE